MHRSLVCPVLVLALLPACSSVPALQGSGQIITEARSVGAFTAIHISGAATLELTQGESVLAEVTCDDNMLPFLRTEVIDGVLVLGFEEGNYRHSETPRFLVQFSELYSLQTSGAIRVSGGDVDTGGLELRSSGAASINWESIRARNLSLSGSGSAKVRIGELGCDSVEIDFSGSGSLEIGSGRASQLSAVLSGASRVAMADVEAINAKVDIGGAGKVALWATDRLEVQSSGSGHVEYRGEPTISSKVSGTGHLKAIED